MVMMEMTNLFVSLNYFIDTGTFICMINNLRISVNTLRSRMFALDSTTKTLDYIIWTSILVKPEAVVLFIYVVMKYLIVLPLL